MTFDLRRFADCDVFRSDKAPRTVVCLGSFDGMHIGHRRVAEAAVALAKELNAAPGAVAFAFPPAALPETPVLLTDTDERSALFASSGLAFAAFADFRELRDVPAEDFITEILVKKFGAVGCCYGFNYRFGKDRRGTPDMLAEYFGKNAVCVPPTTVGGTPVSSSRIRDLLRRGEVRAAAELLGRPFSLTHTVEHGRHDGKRLGIPTLNQTRAPSHLLPKNGVYVTITEVDAVRYPSITDVGTAPTVAASDPIHVETHLIDKSADLYGETVRVEFLTRLRDELLFASEDELKAQIRTDIDAAKRFFERNPIKN